MICRIRCFRKSDKMDQLLKQAAKVLANNTNYATMVSTPMNNSE